MLSFCFASGVTNYVHAFQAAFRLLKTSYLGQGSTRNMVIMFLTDGTPSDDKASIMQTIKDKNEELHNKVVIMTYGMLVNHKILLDIANQDGTSYGVSKSSGVIVSQFLFFCILYGHSSFSFFPFSVSFFFTFTFSFSAVSLSSSFLSPRSPLSFSFPPSFLSDYTYNARAVFQAGKFTTVSDTDNLRSVMATYYDFFSKNTERSKPIISVPYIDAAGLGKLKTLVNCY